MSTAWTCSYQLGDECILLKKACEPGDKGCTLYGKAIFSNPENPSNTAFKRREERQKEKEREEEFSNSKFF